MLEKEIILQYLEKNERFHVEFYYSVHFIIQNKIPRILNTITEILTIFEAHEVLEII